jgi:hypothetical protein
MWLSNSILISVHEMFPSWNIYVIRLTISSIEDVFTLVHFCDKSSKHFQNGILLRQC